MTSEEAVAEALAALARVQALLPRHMQSAHVELAGPRCYVLAGQDVKPEHRCVMDVLDDAERVLRAVSSVRAIR